MEREESKEKNKEENKEKPKAEAKHEAKEESKEEPKAQAKHEAKEENKAGTKQETKAEHSKEKEAIKDKKQKIKTLFKNPYFLTFLAILIIAISLRMYYSNLTETQALWWDEADYMAYAKNIGGFPVKWVVLAKHNSFYPFIAGGLFKLSLSEAMIKFILQIIPSILTVLLVYLICIEMYSDKRIALIASFLTAVFWAHLFNSTRFHVDIPSLFTGLLAIYVFWKGYEKKEKIFKKIEPKWAMATAVILVVLTYTIRRGYFLFGAFFLIYLLSTKKLKELIKDKYNWIALALGFILFFLSEKFIFSSKIKDIGEAYFHEELPITFKPIGVFDSFFSSYGSFPSILLYLFWIGLLIAVVNIFLSFGYIKKSEKSTAKPDLFNIITIILTLAFFMFIIREPSAGEPRWYFPLALGSFIFIAKSTLLIADYTKKYNKYAPVLIVVILIGIGGYYEYKYGDTVIKSKIASFKGIREASLLIKENSNPEDLVLTISRPQVAYYSEREVANPNIWIGWNGTSYDGPFEPVLEKIRNTPQARYILVSFSEPNHPTWMKREDYANINGQAGISSWAIPFMDTKIDFINKSQDIKRSKSYEDITFEIVDIKEDVFIYEIKRQNAQVV